VGKNTPQLDHKGKEEYIKLHLFCELNWLLGAATEWSIQDQLKLEIEGYNVQVYAMDSAFVHARTLFEFFVHATTGNHYGADEFLGSSTTLTSASYSNDWVGPLHTFVMHAQDRSSPTPLTSLGVAKDLKEMPVDFAREILRLWEEFETRLGKSSDPQDQKLQIIAREKRREAIENAQCVVKSTIAQQHAGERHQQLKTIFVFA
jgi:hypothetical protein